MQFNRLTVENTPRIQNNSSIDHHLAWLGAMDKGEVPYVYHHLRKGCILQLHSLSVADDRHLMFFCALRILLSGHSAKHVGKTGATIG